MSMRSAILQRVGKIISSSKSSKNIAAYGACRLFFFSLFFFASLPSIKKAIISLKLNNSCDERDGKNLLDYTKEGSRMEGTLDFDSVNLGANF